MPSRDQAGMDTEGKRWTVQAVYRTHVAHGVSYFKARLTSTDGAGPPRGFRLMPELDHKQEVEQLQGELEGVGNWGRANANEAETLRGRLRAVEGELEAARKERDRLREEVTGNIELLHVFRDEKRAAESQLQELREGVRGEVERRRKRAAEHRDYAMHCESVWVGEDQLRLGHYVDAEADSLHALIDSEPNCTPSKEMLGGAIGNCSERPRIERTSELLRECADAVARSKGDSEWATACNVIAAIERVWDGRSAQAERERRLPADQNPDQRGGDASDPKPVREDRTEEGTDVAGAAVDVGGGLELFSKLEEGRDYYKQWREEAAHEEEVELQRAIRNNVEGNETYAEMANNGRLMALGKQVALEHMAGWLELHVLPLLTAPQHQPSDVEGEAGEEKQRFRHIVGSDFAFTELPLRTMVETGMLDLGGVAEQFREEYGEWFEIMPGGRWRVEALRAAFASTQPDNPDNKREGH